MDRIYNNYRGGVCLLAILYDPLSFYTYELGLYSKGELLFSFYIFMQLFASAQIHGCLFSCRG